MADRDSDLLNLTGIILRTVSTFYFLFWRILFSFYTDMLSWSGVYENGLYVHFIYALRNTFKEIKPKIMLPPFKNGSQNR